MNKEPMKILSIEDDEFMRIFLKDIFWIHGPKENIEFISVSSVKEAEELISNKKIIPNLIFLDLLLPNEKSGKTDMTVSFQFLEKLKSDSQTKNIKVIVFSGYSDKDVKKRLLDSGVEKFLLKGEYLPHELIKIVQDINK